MLHRWFNRSARATNIVAPSASERAASAPLIELRQVVKSYSTPAGDFTALKNVDLQVNRNEFVAVIGKSGSGKSTLINTITGIDRPTSGGVLVRDPPLHRLRAGERAVWRGRNVVVIFQLFQPLPTLTLGENVMLPTALPPLSPPRPRRARALESEEHPSELQSHV